ncbi:MAG: hypothetical protein M3Q10_11040 [Chloroflexota bacterium]|nr:hypothetical protein [Chloroflexota bacterium]
MSDAITIQQRRLTFEEALAEVQRLQAKIAAANPDLSEEDWDTLADAWAEDVNAALANHVRRSRGEPEVPRP